MKITVIQVFITVISDHSFLGQINGHFCFERTVILVQLLTLLLRPRESIKNFSSSDKLVDFRLFRRTRSQRQQEYPKIIAKTKSKFESIEMDSIGVTHQSWTPVIKLAHIRVEHFHMTLHVQCSTLMCANSGPDVPL